MMGHTQGNDAPAHSTTSLTFQNICTKGVQFSSWMFKKCTLNKLILFSFALKFLTTQFQFGFPESLVFRTLRILQKLDISWYSSAFHYHHKVLEAANVWGLSWLLVLLKQGTSSGDDLLATDSQDRAEYCIATDRDKIDLLMAGWVAFSCPSKAMMIQS